MRYVWNETKNTQLWQERGMTFQRIVEAIESSQVLEIRQRQSGVHQGQQYYILHFDDYPWVVPFDREGDTIVLRTAYPSRILKRQLESESEADKV